MSGIQSHQAFQQALEALPVNEQRRVGAGFISGVLDLAEEPRFRDVVTLLQRPEVSAEALSDAYHAIHGIYVATHPRSGFLEPSYARQAEHFIAEACLACLAPVDEAAKRPRLAETAAMYCRMARTCAAIPHDQERPQLARAEALLAQEIQRQHQILSDHLEQG